MNISDNNIDEIGESLENIDWGNLLIKSLKYLQKYSSEDVIPYECNNSKAYNYGEVGSCQFADGEGTDSVSGPGTDSVSGPGTDSVSGPGAGTVSVSGPGESG